MNHSSGRDGRGQSAGSPGGLSGASPSSHSGDNSQPLDPAEPPSVYEILGEAGFYRLVGEFYRRVAEDDILGPMYPPTDWSGAEHRLREFLIFRFGGPDRYTQERGHPRLGLRHSRFMINQQARDRWVRLMDEALLAAELPAEVVARVRSFLHQTATFLINHPSET